ncbi:GPCR fungal pheromone mating factor [Russula brevipes]|nr:GPCR fungal pheromone mating factor [Russula brevipes]
MQPPPNGVYIAFSFVGFAMCAIPFYWHLETWNAGTCLFMAWTGLGCLMQCINSIVWNKNMIDRAPVYCDISTRIQVGLNAAIPACSLCIVRRLYTIATAKRVMPTGAENRRAVITDLLIGLGIPILQMIVQFVVSGHRYDIFEDFGPLHDTITYLPAFFLFFAWPLVIGLVSLSYGARSVYALYKRQLRFKEMMSAAPGLNHDRYFRLMALSSTDIFLTIPITTYFIVLDVKRGVTPWISWSDTHSNYSRVVQVPGVVWKSDSRGSQALEMYRWSLVLCAFVFFAFFGFAEEARQHYRLVYNSLARRIGYRTPSGSSNGLPHGYVVFNVPVPTRTHALTSLF